MTDDEPIEALVLFEMMLERPDLYIGRKSLELLYAFMNGFCLARESQFFNSSAAFQDFVRAIFDRHPNIAHTPGWVAILQFYSSTDEQAFDHFVKLWAEFKTGRNVSQPGE